jgi:hypothetical protein
MQDRDNRSSHARCAGDQEASVVKTRLNRYQHQARWRCRHNLTEQIAADFSVYRDGAEKLGVIEGVESLQPAVTVWIPIRTRSSTKPDPNSPCQGQGTIGGTPCLGPEGVHAEQGVIEVWKPVARVVV